MKVKIIATILILQIFVCQLAFAQTDRGVTNKTVSTTEKRLALVIGNGAYQNAPPLPNPPNDATDMAASLKSLGFEVLSGTNQSKREMETLIREFGTKLSKQGGVGLFFYAGHGLQVKGNNYLIPVEAALPAEDEVEYAAINLSFLLNKMDTAGNNLNIVILDACRNNPFSRSWGGTRSALEDGGLAKITPPKGTIMLYSTQPGNVASDGTGRNGLFTESLLQQIKQPGVELDAMIKALARDVSAKSKEKQLPWKEGIVLGDFYFAGGGGAQPIVNPVPIPVPVTDNSRSAEDVMWDTIARINTRMAVEGYLSEYPSGKYAATARLMLKVFEADEQKKAKEAAEQNAAPISKGPKINLALASNGGVARASSFNGANFPVESITNGDRKGLKWGEGGGWNDGTPETYPDWVEIEFKGSRTIDEIGIFSLQDDYNNPVEPNEQMTFSAYGLTTFEVQYWNGMGWATVPNGKVAKNNKVYNKFKFPSLTTSKIRVLIENAMALYSRIIEIEAWGTQADSDPIQTTGIQPGTLSRHRLGMDLAYIPAGSFEMGSNNRESNEGPVRRVTFSQPFWMGKTEVTQRQWQWLMGDNPSYFKTCGLECPVENMTWDQAQDFIKKLNAMSSEFVYSLPTEAEWEYAARAGTTTEYFTGNTLSLSQANLNGSSTVSVGSYPPNAWGLCDMYGNVFEMVQDITSQNYAGLPQDGQANLRLNPDPARAKQRVVRGSAWNGGAEMARSAFRGGITTWFPSNNQGFRVVAGPR